MNEKIAHLTEAEIETLIERYYNKEKVGDLLEEYNISAQPSQLVRLFPPKNIDELCPYCNNKLTQKYVSRECTWRDEPALCQNCGHKSNNYCYCYNCDEKRRLNTLKELARVKEEIQKKQRMLDDILSLDSVDKIEFDSLLFIEKVYLGAFLREGLSEDMNYIRPIDTFINPLAPTRDLQNEIRDALYGNNIIVIHPDSDMNCFENINMEAGSYDYYSLKVKWALNIKKNELNKVPLIDLIVNPQDLYDAEDAYRLWRTIALHESLQYFYYSVHNVLNIEYSIGKKTNTVFNDLLNDYSVSQIYGIIYRSTNNALRFQTEKGVARQHAANTITGNAQSFAERAKINKWELQKYNRIKECPESSLSKFFFERVLKIGCYVGFNEKPTIK